MADIRKKKRKQKSPLDGIIKVLAVLCIIVAVVLAGLLVKEMTGESIPEPETRGDIITTDNISTTDAETSAALSEETTEKETTAEETTQEETTQEETTQEETTGEETSQSMLWAEEDRIIVNPEQENWSLVVVNGTRAIPEGYTPELSSVAGTDVLMDSRVAPYYTAMYNAAKKDGITLTPYSGYRSYDRQKRNYNNLTEEYMYKYNLSREDAAIKAATVILPPGTSEHNLGLAMDICNTYDSFKNQKEYKWLTEHAHEYGFILRYTAEKQPQTGIIPEPWHWRFVGVEYAEQIKNSGLCLEEWLTANGIAY
ncbi:MAG: M15 family metallopeptidase [Clostridia bacterium]|nr:M15 family metallopeptidase [Clostridia bacterium]